MEFTIIVQLVEKAVQLLCISSTEIKWKGSEIVCFVLSVDPIFFYPSTTWFMCTESWGFVKTLFYTSRSCLLWVYLKSFLCFWAGVDHGQLVGLAEAAFSFLPQGEAAPNEPTKYHGGNKIHLWNVYHLMENSSMKVPKNKFWIKLFTAVNIVGQNEIQVN